MVERRAKLCIRDHQLSGRILQVVRRLIAVSHDGRVETERISHDDDRCGMDTEKRTEQLGDECVGYSSQGLDSGRYKQAAVWTRLWSVVREAWRMWLLERRLGGG